MLLPNGLLLYQFGNAKDKHIVFNKAGFRASLITAVKNLYNPLDGVATTGGSIRYGDRNRSQKYTSYILDVENYKIGKYFNHSYLTGNINTETIATLKNALHDKPKWLFLFDYDTAGNVNKIYYTKAEEARPPKQSEGDRNNNLAPTADYETDFAFTLEKPVFYELDKEYASIVDYNIWANSALTFAGDGILTFAGDGVTTFAGRSNGGGVVGLSLLNQNQLNTYFGGYNPNFFINFIEDKFFGLTNLSVSNSRAILNTTLTTNSLTSIVVTSELMDTTADNEVFLLEVGSLAQNEYISIIDTENNSGMKLTWLHTSSSGTITYNSATGKVYNTTTRALIPDSYYRIEQESDYFLYFSPRKQNQDFNLNAPETLAITKFTSDNLLVKMEVLKSYI